MTDNEIALFNQLPGTWQELILDFEAKDWIVQREKALQIKQKISQDGGHIMLSDHVFDPDTLSEPLQTRVKMLLARSRPSTDKSPSFF